MRRRGCLPRLFTSTGLEVLSGPTRWLALHLTETTSMSKLTACCADYIQRLSPKQRRRLPVWEVQSFAIPQPTCYASMGSLLFRWYSLDARVMKVGGSVGKLDLMQV